MCARTCCARMRVPSQATMSLLRPSACFAYVHAHVLCAHARAKSGHNEPPEAFCGCFAAQCTHACCACARVPKQAKMSLPRPSGCFAHSEIPGRSILKFKFPGRGERNTPVIDARGIVEAKALITGRGRDFAAHQFRIAASQFPEVREKTITSGRRSCTSLLHSPPQSPVLGLFWPQAPKWLPGGPQGGTFRPQPAKLLPGGRQTAILSTFHPAFFGRSLLSARRASEEHFEHLSGRRAILAPRQFPNLESLWEPVAAV